MSRAHAVDVYTAKFTRFCHNSITSATRQPWRTPHFLHSPLSFSPPSVTLHSLTVSIKCRVCVKRAALVPLPVLLRGSELCERTPLRKQGVTVNTIRTANSVWFGLLDANIQRSVLLWHVSKIPRAHVIYLTLNNFLFFFSVLRWQTIPDAKSMFVLW